MTGVHVIQQFAEQHGLEVEVFTSLAGTQTVDVSVPDVADDFRNLTAEQIAGLDSLVFQDHVCLELRGACNQGSYYRFHFTL